MTTNDLETTVKTLAAIEETFWRSNEKDLGRAFQLVRKEVEERLAAATGVPTDRTEAPWLEYDQIADEEP